MSSMSTLFFLVIIFATSSSSKAFDNHILLLRPRSGSSGNKIPQINCLSWRLAVETNNLRDWKLVPAACETYVGNYMLGKQYNIDCQVVADAAIEYAKTLTVNGDGKDIWIFDIDETTLSNIPYYARSDVAFGAVAYNDTKFGEWLEEGIAPAVPAVLRLYETVVSLGIKAVFLTGTAERFTDVRIANLQREGYTTWEKLILKGENDTGGSVEYKSSKRTELVNSGYRIVGNIGDQWSDLLGDNPGGRTFKVPDPMYYIG